MIRVTIELLPGGDAERAKVIGQIDIANIGVSPSNLGTYAVVLKKMPPFSGALKHAWKTGIYNGKAEDEEVMQGIVEGHHRTRRGVYDLLYSALVSCGLNLRSATTYNGMS